MNNRRFQFRLAANQFHTVQNQPVRWLTRGNSCQGYFRNGSVCVCGLFVQKEWLPRLSFPQKCSVKRKLKRIHGRRSQEMMWQQTFKNVMENSTPTPILLTCRLNRRNGILFPENRCENSLIIFSVARSLLSKSIMWNRKWLTFDECLHDGIKLKTSKCQLL